MAHFLPLSAPPSAPTTPLRSRAQRPRLMYERLLSVLRERQLDWLHSSSAGWLIATLIAMLSSSVYCAAIFCIWMLWGVLVAVTSMPSAEAKPPAALSAGMQIACGIPAMEVYKMLCRRFGHGFGAAAAGPSHGNISREESLSALSVALWSHSFNLLAALVVVELVAACKVRPWAGLRLYLGAIAINGFSSVAGVAAMGVGGPYPAPGGTAPSPINLLACSCIALVIAVGATPGSRRRALEACDIFAGRYTTRSLADGG